MQSNRHDHLNIDPNKLEWRAIAYHTGNPQSRLLATLLIGGVSHHLEAIQVEVRDGVQTAVDLTSVDELRAYADVSGTEGDFATVRINERDYVLVMTPFWVTPREEPQQFLMKYRHCAKVWTQIWSSTCNDKCPCGAEVEPYKVEDA